MDIHLDHFSIVLLEFSLPPIYNFQKDSSVSNETSKNLFENYKSLSEKVQEARKPRTITDMYFEDDEDEDPFVGVVPNSRRRKNK